MPDTEPRPEHRVYELGDLRLDEGAFELVGPDEAIPVEPRVIELLVHLIEHRNRVVTKDELVEVVWGGRPVGDGALSQTVSQARKCLGDDGRRQEWIATVHGRGYRFVGEARVQAPDRDRNGRMDPRRRRRLVTAAAGSLVACGLVLAWTLLPRPAPPPPTERALRVAVVPPAAPRELASIALCEGIAARLATLPGVLVRPCGDTARLATEVSSLGELAGELGADVVVHGSIGNSPALLELSLYRVAQDGRERLPAMPVALSEILESTSALGTASENAASEIGRRLGGRLPETGRRLGLVDMAAHGLYLRGTWWRHPRCGDSGRLDLVVRASSRNPDFYPGWVLLAEEHLFLAGRCGLHPAHYDGAVTALGNAADSGAPIPLTAGLRARGLVERGRLLEAYEEIRRAERRGADARLDWAAARTLLYAGALDAARRRWHRALAADPDHARLADGGELLALDLGVAGALEGLDPAAPLDDPDSCLARALSALRRHRADEAIAALRPAFRFDPANQSARIAEALQAIVQGATEEGMRILAELERVRLGVGAGDPAVDYRIGQAYALAGAPAPAVNALRRAVIGGFLCAACAAADPLWDAASDEAGFGEVLRLAGERSESFARRARLASAEKSP